MKVNIYVVIICLPYINERFINLYFWWIEKIGLLLKNEVKK